MASTTVEKTAKKGSKNPLLFVGIGCLVLLVILGIVGSLLGNFIFKKAGTSFLESVIEKKTGVKTDISDLEKGKMTFTDEKTGAKVDIGTGKIPDTFPKDFPIYPGSQVLSVMSGSEKAGSGFWVTLSSADSLDKVSEYYKAQLSANGWEAISNYSAGEMSTQTVQKGELQGSVSVTRGEDAKETQIVIMLGNDK
jgi:hypothetical protein